MRDGTLSLTSELAWLLHTHAVLTLSAAEGKKKLQHIINPHQC